MKLPPKLLRIYRNLPGIHELIQIRNHLAHLQEELAALRALNLKEIDLLTNPRFKDPKRLLAYGFQVCSQNEEDGMIREIFRRIGTGSSDYAAIPTISTIARRITPSKTSRLTAITTRPWSPIAERNI